VRVRPGYSRSWTSAVPITSSGSRKTMNTRRRFEDVTANLNTGSCHSVEYTHRLRSSRTSMIAYGHTLTTSRYANLTTYSSIRRTTRSTRSMCAKCCSDLRNSAVIAKPRSANLQYRKSLLLGFVITPQGVGMESDRISTIEDWPTPKPSRDVQVLLGFTNFYRRFIQKYAKVTLPLSELLKNADTADEPPKGRPRHQTSENCGKVKWEWTRQADVAFRKLKRTFTEAPIPQHFDPAKPIILQTEASGLGIAGILKQYDGFGVLRPVNFYSGKYSSAEQNYDTYDPELLAIMETLEQWRHYLEGAYNKVLIRCDHKNLEYFQTSKVFSRRQARWSETLLA